MSVMMKAPDGCGSLSYAGETLVPTKKGLVRIPSAAVSELLQFGFKVADPQDSDDQEAVLEAQQAQAAFDAGIAEKAALDAAQAATEAAAKAVSDKVQGLS